MGGLFWGRRHLGGRWSWGADWRKWVAASGQMVSRLTLGLGCGGGEVYVWQGARGKPNGTSVERGRFLGSRPCTGVDGEQQVGLGSAGARQDWLPRRSVCLEEI